MGTFVLQVLVDIPRAAHFDFLPPEPDLTQNNASQVSDLLLWIGQRVLVPWAKSKKIGVVIGVSPDSQVVRSKLRAVLALLDDAPPLTEADLARYRFVAHYYKANLSEVVFAALPPILKQANRYRATPNDSGRISYLAPKRRASNGAKARLNKTTQDFALNNEQQAAVDTVGAHLGQWRCFLLFGITGSGKSAVYEHIADKALQNGQQVLWLVPEISLTPKLIDRLQQRFAQYRIALLTSAVAQVSRGYHWLDAAQGMAQLIVGTRLAMLTPLPNLGLIVVDEEHDSSYKQQEGVRYHARDLAIWRGKQENIPVVLGSATPSLETWYRSEPSGHEDKKSITRLYLTQRAVASAQVAKVTQVDTRGLPQDHAAFPELTLQNIRQCLAREEQVLVFLNRRGYAPVVCCDHCGWVCQCPQCSAFMVWHRQEAQLRCHHCGYRSKIPHHCDECGDVELKAVGSGTEKIEELLQEHFAQARIARIDRDTAQNKGFLQKTLDDTQSGKVDILIGTQMLAKGHDFPRLTLVVVLGSDGMLMNPDFRGRERLYALLTQVSGRAGRSHMAGEVLIHTRYVGQPLYTQVAEHDFASFAASQLEERRSLALPPFRHLALITANAQNRHEAEVFLQQARDFLLQGEGLSVNDPVSMRMERIALRERVQMLVEAAHRPYLQKALDAFKVYADGLKTSADLRWAIDVDPLET